MSIVIKDNVSLERDLTSGAVINTNDSLYQKRLNQIQALKHQEEKEKAFNDEFETLKDDVNEIKDLLKTLLASNE